MGCCCKAVVIIAAFLAGWVGYKVYKVVYDIPPLPDLPLNQWWGPGAPNPKDDTSIRPFKVQFTPEMIADLKERLNKANYYTDPMEGIGFQYGFNNNYLKEVVEFWKNEYNFEERELFLNKFVQYKTRIQGLDIHYLRVKPKSVDSSVRVLPLLLLHGWPGSVVEFYKIIPLLITPRPGVSYVFEVIAPSLPGYGFSQAAAKPGLGAAQMAVIMKNLMDRLGYKKYFIQGGDWGSVISSNMATLYPKNVIGYHTNMPVAQSGLSMLKLIIGSLYPPLVVEKKHESKLYPFIEKLQLLLEESGYFHIQATKPDTVGVALRDSPVGLAAYILEKFSTSTNKDWRSLPDGGLTKKFSLIELLDNIMVYWASNSITTSLRIYAETINKAQFSLNLDSIPITIPVSVTRCANELTYVTKCQIKEKYLHMIQVTDYDDCGHFTAFEEPQLLANDIWSSVPLFEDFYKPVNNKKEL